MSPATWRGTSATLAAGLVWSASLASAGPADVLAARGQCKGEVCQFWATLRHADSGWDHYANRFQVLGPHDKVLATRVLRHPHVNEQPFTRSIQAVRVPLDIERVRLRAGDSRHGLGGAEVEIELERGESERSEPGRDTPSR